MRRLTGPGTGVRRYQWSWSTPNESRRRDGLPADPSGVGTAGGECRGDPETVVFEIVGKQGRWLMVRLSEHETTLRYVDNQVAVVKNLHDDAQRRFPIPGTYLTTTPVNVRGGPAGFR